jgi:hypothetical protein
MAALMNIPRVSVLMAAYNSAAYLEEAVASVLAQTMSDFELIVIDDGSKDETPEVLARLAAGDPRIVAHRQANQGIGGATNTGLRLARADYVAILDSDDAMEPERLAIQADYLDGNPEIAAVGSQWYTMGTDGRITGIDRHPTSPSSVMDFIFAYFSMHHPTIMARKSVILACGAYDAVRRQGTRDYEVFLNLALAGHQLNNLAQILTRWRINPAGVTHSKARPQTEDAVEMRSHAMVQLAVQSPDRAKEVAKRLVRTFPVGSWFDEKVARLIPDAAPSPALSIWRDLASKGELPKLEVLVVDWLNEEAQHADALARELEAVALPWLAELVRAKHGGAMPRPIRQGISGDQQRTSDCSVSLLIPAFASDDDLLQRVNAALANLPSDGELLVFAADTTEVPGLDLPADTRLRFLPAPPEPRNAWLEAVAAGAGRYIAWLEPGQRHHPDFLVQGLAWLDSHPENALAYGPADLFYADALDAQGSPVKDPAWEPRWSRETLLGRDRVRLGAMVHRREVLNNLPLDLRQTGTETGWALARYLLTRYRPAMLDLRNIEFAAPVQSSNNIMAVMIRRLVRWYLDTGLGSVPSAYAWHDMAPAAAQERLRGLEAALAGGELCIHPGNTQELLAFASRFSQMPAMDKTYRALLLANPQAALAILRKQRPIQFPFVLATWAIQRLWHKLSR